MSSNEAVAGDRPTLQAPQHSTILTTINYVPGFFHCFFRTSGSYGLGVRDGTRRTSARGGHARLTKSVPQEPGQVRCSGASTSE